MNSVPSTRRRLVKAVIAGISSVSWAILWYTVDVIVLFTEGPGPGDSMIGDFVMHHPFSIYPWLRALARLSIFTIIGGGGTLIWIELGDSASLLRSASYAIIPGLPVLLMAIIEHWSAGKEFYAIALFAWIAISLIAAASFRFFKSLISRPR